LERIQFQVSGFKFLASISQSRAFLETGNLKPETEPYRPATRSGRWNISTSADTFSARRFVPCS
jgi:hypothetical protein